MLTLMTRCHSSKDEVEHRADLPDAGRIHQHVEPAQRRFRRGDEFGGRGGVGDIQAEGMRLAALGADGGRGGLGIGEVEVADGDAGALPRRGIADLLADAAAAAGDEHGLILEAHGCFLRYFTGRLDAGPGHRNRPPG